MLKWIKKRIVLLIIILVVCILIVPFFINLLFKFDIGISFLEAEWKAEDALSYYGTVLSFTGTVILSILALYQNDLIRQESNERIKLIEGKEHESNMPKFSITTIGFIEKYGEIHISIKNISHNIATNINLSNVKIVSEDNKIIWENQISAIFDSIDANNAAEYKLNNPQINNENDIIFIMMSCEDKYNKVHSYLIKGIITKFNDLLHFKILEI